jgi:hypothetical protein
MDYTYKINAEIKYDEAFAELNKRFPSRVCEGWPSLKYSPDEELLILKSFRELGVKVKTINIRKKDYLDFLKMIDYQSYKYQVVI